MIRKYYTDRSLLITGGTGFVGQALLAKILRELGDEVRRVFLMIRPRRRTDGREISPAERLQELYRTTLFEPMAEGDPGRWERLREKVVPVAIDERQADLGLSSEDRKRLVAEVDTIFNSAATVVFDEPLDVSVQANVAGPLALMEIARASKRPVDFVHVSTAYVNGRRQGRIPDEPLPVDRDMRQIVDGSGAGFDPVSEVADCRAACRRLREEAAAEDLTRRLEGEVAREYGRTGSRKLTSTRLEQLVEDRRARWVQRRLVAEGMRRAREHGWNDVYTYTKALGEQLLTLRRGDVPLVVVRPSIIESSLADPEPGWITGLKVMDPLVVAYGRGLLPDFPARPEIVLDLVPVDRVVNATIAAAVRARPDSVEVFQVATGTENPVRLGSLFDSVRAHFLRSPMPDRDGGAPPLPDWRYPSVRLFRTVFRLRHLGPIQLREWLLDLPGRSPAPRQRRLLGTAKVRLQRVLYYVDLYHPYTHLDCRFETARTRALWESLPPDERGAFDMDVTGIDWPAYVADIHLPGLRRHVLGEESAPEAALPEAPGEPGVEEERLRAEREISTLPDLLRWACARHAGRTAFEARREGRWQRTTYAELLQRVEERAGRWQGLGLTLGDRVLLAGENGPDWVVSYMACSFLGAAVVPVDPQTPGEEVERIAAFCEARAIVAGAAVLEGIVPVAGRTRIDLLSGAPAGEAAGAARSAFQEPEISQDREASIIFTSGTRVDPRGVVLTHGNLISDLLALGEVQRVYDSDRILSVLPLHHGLEFTGALLTSLWGGASTFYLDGPLNSRSILDTIREQEITAVLAVPRILKILADRVQRLDTRTDGARPDDVEVLRRPEADRLRRRPSRRGAVRCLPGSGPHRLRGIRTDRDIADRHRQSSRGRPPGVRRRRPALCRAADRRAPRARRRDPRLRVVGDPGLPEPAGPDRRGPEGRLAAHRRPRPPRRGRLPLHHRPAARPDRHRRGQERLSRRGGRPLQRPAPHGRAGRRRPALGPHPRRGGARCRRPRSPGPRHGPARDGGADPGKGLRPLPRPADLAAHRQAAHPAPAPSTSRRRPRRSRRPARGSRAGRAGRGGRRRQPGSVGAPGLPQAEPSLGTGRR